MLILAHEKLSANKIDISKTQAIIGAGASDRTMPHVRGLPLQPLARATHVGLSRFYAGTLDVLEGIDPAVPLREATSSLWGGPEWKTRFVVVNEGCVNVYKSQDAFNNYCGQSGLKASLMLQFVSAFVPSFE